MAKVPFNSENKSQSIYDFPKLSLGQGEKARVVIIDDAPEMEYVHTLRAPKLENGKPVIVQVKGKDGTFRDEQDHDFVGRFICLGNIDKLAKSGLDPDNCPLCERAESSQAFDRPQRRFAMHVVRYKTKPGTFKVQEPFGAELVVWSFPDRVFNAITDMGEEHGDLRTKDLMLGPCENKTYQKFDINIGGKAEWLADDDRKQYVKTLVAENRVEDLVPIIARKSTRTALDEEIDRVERKVAQSKGKDVSDDGGDEGDDIDLDSLLPGDDDEEATDDVAAETEPDDEEGTSDEPDAEDDDESEDDEEEAPTEVPDPPKKKAKKAPAKKAAAKKKDEDTEVGSIEDLDDLLAGL